MKKLRLLFIAFVSLSNYSYSQEYAELIAHGPNRNPDSFKGYLEYSSDTPPIQSSNCKKSLICEYPMSVMQFIKEMELNGWTLESTSVAYSEHGSYSQYFFRKE